MKNLDAFMKNLYVSLKDINEKYKCKIQNLEGYKINECYGCDGNCSCEPCKCEPECPYTNGVTVTTLNQFGRFNSEQEIIRELDTCVKVNTLYDIHAQFGRFNFVKDINKGYVEPFYFGNRTCYNINEPINRENDDMPTRKSDPDKIESLYDVPTCQNKKIYKVVTDIVDIFGLVIPVIQTKINGEVQVYAVKHTGSNGKENSIKTSLEEVAKILTKLDSRPEIQWSQVLDVSIDNIDDLYAFVITFVFDPDKVRETLKTEK